MLKRYEFAGTVFQFEEGKQPDGAVEVKATKKADKKAPEKKNKKGE